MTDRLECHGGPLDGVFMANDGVAFAIIVFEPAGKREPYRQVKFAMVVAAPPFGSHCPIHVYRRCDEGHFHHEAVQ